MPLRLPLPGLAEAAAAQRQLDFRPGQSAFESELEMDQRLQPVRDRVDERLFLLGRRRRNPCDAEFGFLVEDFPDKLIPGNNLAPLATTPTLQQRVPTGKVPNRGPRLRWSSSALEGSHLMRLGSLARSGPRAIPNGVLPSLPMLQNESDVTVVGAVQGRQRPLSRSRMRERVLERLKKTFVAKDLYQNPLKCIKSLQMRGDF